MKNNIDTVFKTRLDEVNADDSMMGQDWQAMQGLMGAAPPSQPAGSGAGVVTRKLLAAISITSVIIVAAFLVWQLSKPGSNNDASQLAANSGKHARIDTTIVIQPDTLHIKHYAIRFKNDSNQVNGKPTQFVILRDTLRLKPSPLNIRRDTLVLKPAPVINDYDTVTVKVTPVIIKTDRQILDSFYNALKTPTQLFKIDNARDTTITGKDGSEIWVPANSFIAADSTIITHAVTLTLDECYSYADIVAHRLFTISNNLLLASGGMLKIAAKAKDKTLSLLPGKELLVKMPAKEKDADMSLFLPAQCKNCDSAATINWLPANGLVAIQNIFMFGNRYPPKRVATVFNLQDDPFNTVTRGTKTIGKFRVSKTCKMSKLQMIAELKKRYPYYNEIKIRLTSQPHSYAAGYLFSKETRMEPVIGDSVTVTVEHADRWKLWTAADKAKFEIKYKAQLEEFYRAQKDDSLRNLALTSLENKYSFRIRNLQWINCDHFYKDGRRKVNYVINLKDDATHYDSQIIFTGQRMAMPADVNGNYVSFHGVPLGEEVQLISIGVKQGRIVVGTQKFTISNKTGEGVEYKTLTADETKTMLRTSDMK